VIDRRAVVRVLCALVLVALTERPALALPTMIRLGYSECGACHISPQGGGPLNLYGRGIDRAQSLIGGEYTPATDDFTRALTLDGRMTHDVRTVIQELTTHTPGHVDESRWWPRLMYRNVTDIAKGFRVSATLTGETDSTLRPALSYDPPSEASSVFVNTALLQYRTGEVEFAVGRDQLPTGINIPDLAPWIKSRNRLGYYDAPTQFKMFWTGSRVHLAPFVYGPGGNEAPGEREKGAGTVAEFVLGDHQRTVLGTSVLGGSSANGARRVLGGFVRVGFGQWGILAEHDRTDRTREAPAGASFTQDASYAQLFWAAREWLVLSGTGERLHVDQPFEERALAAKLELTARLAPQATVGVSSRVQRDQITGRVSTLITLQVALKTAR
jgi:hypothetical protein